MKNKFLLFAAALIMLTGCEKKQVAEPSNVKIAFQYREVEDVLEANTPEEEKRMHTIEIRSTSEPAFIAPDLWYNFGTDYAMQIGDGNHRFTKIGTYNVTVLYKPAVAPDFDKIYASQKFTFTIDGVRDSIWKPAIPVEL